MNCVTLTPEKRSDMMPCCRRIVLWAVVAPLASTVVCFAEETPVKRLDQAQLRDAIERGLRVIEKSAANYPKHRECFSCHHQTLPILATSAARASEFDIDESLLEAQAAFTLDDFTRRKEKLLRGRGIGGTSMTVAYGLWALDLAGSDSSDVTEAMVTFLLKNQQEEDHWEPFTSRPPMEDSQLTCTVLAVYGIEKYGSVEQKRQVHAAIDGTRQWMIDADAKTQEDRAAQLWGLHLLEYGEGPVLEARQAVLDAQKPDGGWAQLSAMDSDAYATGLSLFVLHETGLSAADPAVRRGAQFLLSNQCKDGSWLVETRSKPVQVFFDNGDPHGKHQFISISATCWAVAALCQAIN